MAESESGWSIASWVAGFSVFVVVTAGAQYLAVELYRAVWNSNGAAGQPIPHNTVEFLKWVVGAGVGLGAAKLVGDRVD